MSNNTNIQFKRTNLNVDSLDTNNEKLIFGEPLLIDTAFNDPKYLVIGPSISNEGDVTVSESAVSNSIFFRGMSKTDAEHGVTFDDNNILIATPSSNNPTYLKTKVISSTTKAGTGTNDDETLDTTKYFIVCQNNAGELFYFDVGDYGIYIDSKGVMHGAAWNDYAEARRCDDCTEPGQLNGKVVCEKGDGTLSLSTERLQPCSYVVSDTFGQVIGIGNINVAVAGKALVYTDDEVKVGDCLTAGENGKAVKMTRQEIINYPDRILGIVIEIPDYETVNNIMIDGRVWIKVK